MTFTCRTSTVTDIEGNVYSTVMLATQCWMSENLRTTKYANGVDIPNGGTNGSNTDPYYYSNTNSALSLQQRGLLYNWPAVMNGASSSEANPSGVQGICPTGWHVPSEAEIDALISYVSSQSEFVCGSNNGHIAKALASQEGWESSTTDCAVGNNPELNNATGFSAFPAGMLDSSNEFSVDISEAAFWTTSSTPANPLYVYYYHLTNYIKDFIYPQTTKNYGMSVRCVRNN